MGGLPISSEYVDKGFLFALLLGFITVLSIGGCNDGSGGSDDQALTENDFAEDSSISANPEEGVLTTFLEASTSEKPENDTGEVGEDEIPLKYENAIKQTFCWEDDNGEAAHFMELKDSRGNEVLRVDVNGDCVTRVIQAGDYVMAIHHDGNSEDTVAIFVKPIRDELEQARETDGLINSLKSVALNISRGIEKTVTKDAEAQSNIEKNRATLIITNSCSGCDLTGANFAGAFLSRANLTRADLSNAIMPKAKLDSANLTGAKLRGANLTDAILTVADLPNAIMSNVILVRARLTGADLRGANLTGADLRGALLLGAKLLGTVFDNAIWCNGCMCAEQSTDACVGCPSVIEVCLGS